MAIFGTIDPPGKLTFEEVGIGNPVGHTANQPHADALTDVTLRYTAVALLGIPNAPAT
jgi:hypothetical protein